MQPTRRRLVIGAAAAVLSLPMGVAALVAPAAADPGDQGVASDHSSGTAGTSGDPSSPQPGSNADFSGNGANTNGPYDSTRDGSPSLNGNGGGESVGKPCAGCVGKADNKNPQGQMPDGSDANAGYECDRNHGIGRSNPAHTSCQPGEQPPGEQPPGEQPPGEQPPGEQPPGKEKPAGPPEAAPPGGELPDTGASVAPLAMGLGALGLGGVLVLTSALMRRRYNAA